MPASILTAVANEPNKEPRENSVVTIADILEVAEKAMADHPNWFIPGQGWGPQVTITEEGDNAINSNH